jgi:hypothetical protein
MIHVCLGFCLSTLSLASTLQALAGPEPRLPTTDPTVAPHLPIVERLEVDIPPPQRAVRCEPPNYLLHITPVFPQQDQVQ